MVFHGYQKKEPGPPLPAKPVSLFSQTFQLIKKLPRTLRAPFGHKKAPAATGEVDALHFTLKLRSASKPLHLYDATSPLFETLCRTMLHPRVPVYHLPGPGASPPGQYQI